VVAQRVTWPSAEELEANRRNLIRRLQATIADYETRHGIRSDQLRAELTAGRIRETAEIADWLISFKTLRKLQHERPARVE
jgi:hypothetical protein